MSEGQRKDRGDMPCPHCKDDRQTERIPDGSWFCQTCGRVWVDHLPRTLDGPPCVSKT